MNLSCTFCGSDRAGILFSTGVGDSIFCEGCGGIRNRNKAGAAIYTKQYYQSHYAAIEPQQIERFTQILQSAEPYVEQRRVLDIGCGTGVFLKVAYQLGYRRSAGVDVHLDAVDIARQKVQGTDITIHSSWDAAEGQFGAISFMDSIGHIENMEKTVTALLREKLSPNGLLLVKTPHFSRTYFRYCQCVGWLLATLGKANSVSQELFFLPNRFWLFTQSALENFITRQGFEIISRSVQQEYSVKRAAGPGLRNKVFYLLFRRLPESIWGKKTIVVVARKRS